MNHENESIGFVSHLKNYVLHLKNFVTPKNGATIDSIEKQLLPGIPRPSRNSLVYAPRVYLGSVESIESNFADGLLSILKTIEKHAEGLLYNVVLMQVKVDLMQVKVDNVANKDFMNVGICKAP